METSASAEKIHIFIVDDHRLLRDGLVALLEQFDEVEIVGAVASGEEAIEATASLNPHIILMQGMSGIEATRWIKERNRNTKVILVSSAVTRELVAASIACGVDGYMHKDADANALRQAVRAVMSGGRAFDEVITNLVFEDFYLKKKHSAVHESVKAQDDLTKRENEVLAQVASGKSSREVADILFISVKTVDTHKSHILDKLGLKNTAELVKYAVKIT